MDVELTKQELGFVNQQLDDFSKDFANSVLNPVHKVLRYKSPPPTIANFLQDMQNLQANLGQYSSRGTACLLGEATAPILKLVMLARRRVVASDVDARNAKTTNSEVIVKLNEELSPFDSILQKEWAKATVALRMPRISDFLTLEEVEKVLDQRGVRFPARQYDEKFHLLQAPSQLSSDLNYYRDACESRGIALAIAYIDIDDFRKLNTKYGHIAVDRDVLPVFMRALEGFAFARGYGYRFGGDEYALLLPNGRGAEKTIQDLRRIVEGLSYTGIAEKTTISIGLFVVEPDSPLTDQALVERANRAMRFAKDRGKNCVAKYNGRGHRDEDLQLMDA